MPLILHGSNYQIALHVCTSCMKYNCSISISLHLQDKFMSLCVFSLTPCFDDPFLLSSIPVFSSIATTKADVLWMVAVLLLEMLPLRLFGA